MMVLPPVGYVKELLYIKCLGQTLVHADAQPVTCGAVVGLSRCGRWEAAASTTSTTFLPLG